MFFYCVDIIDIINKYIKFQNGSVHSFNDIPTLLYAACQYLGYYSYVKK